MNAAPSRQDLERFRAVIGRKIGLHFDDNKLGFLGEVLQRRLAKVGHGADIYLAGLERAPIDGEFNSLAPDLTVGETYFFRNVEQFHALAEIVIPSRLKARPRDSTLRLLSAGCASGEEAYSIAIVAQEALVQHGGTVEISGVDINPAALQKAKRARYSSWALRETPSDIEARWFSRDGDDAALKTTLCDGVTFGLANLAGDDPAFWQSTRYDVIFCRNVLMYFSAEQMRAVVARIARSLAPGGFLFLGHAETLRDVSDRFHLRHSHGTFYYELKADVPLNGETSSRIAPPPVQPVAPGISGQDWYEAICKASERVASLVPGTKPSVSVPPAPSAGWDMAATLDLLRQERFGAALDHIRARPPAAESDAEALLLEATLFVHAGQPANAEDACRKLLSVDEFNAGAHYLLALCSEQAGELADAGKHDRVAAYLDSQFAMPRLHLGLLAGRTGDHATARQELAQALTLLGREDSSRLLLFGGGFSRAALVAFCQAALRENGGSA